MQWWSFKMPCGGKQLSLMTGPNLYTYFWKVLTGKVRDEFEVICSDHPNTINGFQVALEQMIACYVCTTDLVDQQHYLEMERKPFTLNFQALGSCLKMSNKLMALWPGQGCNQPFDDMGLKRLYYNLMLESWKFSFLEQGLDFAEPTYTFDAMNLQFELLEKLFNLQWPM